MIKNREQGSPLLLRRSFFPVFCIELISCMLEARKSRISGLLQIPKKADTHYRTDIQRFKEPPTMPELGSLAERCGISKEAVSKWAKKGWIE